MNLTRHEYTSKYGKVFITAIHDGVIRVETGQDEDNHHNRIEVNGVQHSGYCHFEPDPATGELRTRENWRNLERVGAGDVSPSARKKVQEEFLRLANQFKLEHPDEVLKGRIDGNRCDRERVQDKINKLMSELHKLDNEMEALQKAHNILDLEYTVLTGKEVDE